MNREKAKELISESLYTTLEEDYDNYVINEWSVQDLADQGFMGDLFGLYLVIDDKRFLIEIKEDPSART